MKVGDLRRRDVGKYATYSSPGNNRSGEITEIHHTFDDMTILYLDGKPLRITRDAKQYVELDDRKLL